MRRTSCLHSLGLGLGFLSFAASPACQSSAPSDPPAFVNPSGSSAAGDDALLASLEINPAEEPIADEQGGPGVGQDGSLASDHERDAQLDEFGEAVIDTPAEQLLENPVFDDEEEEADITTLSVNPLVTPGQLPGSDQASALVHGPWKCVLAGSVVPNCSCKGSPRNCYVPNTQPGRNRYLPPAFAAEIPKRLAATRAAVDAANAAAAAATPPGAKQDAPKAPVDGGKFHITPGSVVYDGKGIARGTLSPPALLPRGHGEVAGRFGWVALDAIKIAAVDPHAPTGVFADKCAQKNDGTYCDETTPVLGYKCSGHQISQGLHCDFPLNTCTGPSADGIRWSASTELACRSAEWPQPPGSAQKPS